MKLLLLSLLVISTQAFFLPWGFGGDTVGTPPPSLLHSGLHHWPQDNRRTPSPADDLNRRTPQPDGTSGEKDTVIHSEESDLIRSRAPVNHFRRRTSPPVVDVLLSRAPEDHSLNRRTPPPVDGRRTPPPEVDVLLSRAPADINLNRRTPPPAVDGRRTFPPAVDVLLSRAPELHLNRRTPPPSEDRFTRGVLLSRAPSDDEIRRRTTPSGEADPPVAYRKRHSLPFALPTWPSFAKDFFHRRSTPGDFAPPAEDCDHGKTTASSVNVVL